MVDIAIQGVRKSYGRQEVVHGVDLAVRDGEFLVILGPSGCGKSTLLRMVAGLERITAGEIRIDGQRVNELEPRARGCAMVFQNYALYPHMSVEANIGYALKIAGVKRAERRERVRQTAAVLGLEEYLGRRPSELSGGQRQRVAMGRAIVREPKVFLFDEPLSNLDAKLRVAMRLEIRRLHERLGATSIFVTHDQVEAMTLADRLVVMNAGLIEQVGTPRDVYAEPTSRFVAQFIGSPPISIVAGTVEAPGRVRIGDGVLPFRHDAFHAAPGTGVDVGMRAEAVRLSPAEGSQGIGATVTLTEELGSARLVHLDIAGMSVVATTPNSTALASGTPVRLEADMDDVQLFDAATGARLGPQEGGAAASVTAEQAA